jgi:hypothetical protein
MSLQTAGDIPLLVSSENASTERRITPSWTIGQWKSKLEPVTGIPPLSQKLTLKHGNQSTPIEAADEENTQLGTFPLAPYAEIIVSREGFCILSDYFWTVTQGGTCWPCRFEKPPPIKQINLFFTLLAVKFSLKWIVLLERAIEGNDKRFEKKRRNGGNASSPV